MAVEAIPRRYGKLGGTQTDFRSTLEADWAFTLDGLGLDWQYEPHLFTLPSGTRYLPDFWLPQIGTWIEVKGDGVPRIEKAAELADLLLCKCEGRCRCEWYGGRIVLIGRWWGWHDALGLNTYLVTCSHCGTPSWRRLRHSLRCRKCREPWSNGEQLKSDIQIDRVDRAPWTVAS